MLLRGEAFRLGWRYAGGCDHSGNATRFQLAAWESLFNHIITPLEQCNSTVEIHATECSASSGCPLIHELARLAGNRLANLTTRCHTNGQAESMKLTLDAFRGSRPGTFDLIFVTRHDVIWKRPIHTWRHINGRLNGRLYGVNFSSFNFLSLCEDVKERQQWRHNQEIMQRCNVSSSSESSVRVRDASSTSSSCSLDLTPPAAFCVHDLLHMLPGRLFSSLSRAVGRDRCFAPRPNQSDPGAQGTENGHRCYSAIARYLRLQNESEPTTVLTAWRPQKNVREDSPLTSVASRQWLRAFRDG